MTLYILFLLKDYSFKEYSYFKHKLLLIGINHLIVFIIYIVLIILKSLNNFDFNFGISMVAYYFRFMNDYRCMNFEDLIKTYELLTGVYNIPPIFDNVGSLVNNNFGNIVLFQNKNIVTMYQTTKGQTSNIKEYLEKINNVEHGYDFKINDEFPNVKKPEIKRLKLDTQDEKFRKLLEEASKNSIWCDYLPLLERTNCKKIMCFIIASLDNDLDPFPLTFIKIKSTKGRLWVLNKNKKPIKQSLIRYLCECLNVQHKIREKDKNLSFYDRIINKYYYQMILVKNDISDEDYLKKDISFPQSLIDLKNKYEILEEKKRMIKPHSVVIKEKVDQSTHNSPYESETEGEVKSNKDEINKLLAEIKVLNSQYNV